jgi:hypothetical protein
MPSNARPCAAGTRKTELPESARLVLAQHLASQAPEKVILPSIKIQYILFYYILFVNNVGHAVKMRVFSLFCCDGRENARAFLFGNV